MYSDLSYSHFFTHMKSTLENGTLIENTYYFKKPPAYLLQSYWNMYSICHKMICINYSRFGISALSLFDTIFLHLALKRKKGKSQY